VLAATLAAECLSWRDAYKLGGIAGFLLLSARMLVPESNLYEKTASRAGNRGGLSAILRNPRRLRKYLAVIFMMTPTTFIPQILWTLSPELARAHGIVEPVKANIVVGIGFSCVIFGDLIACVLSEVLRSRKKAILISYMFGAVCFLSYFLLRGQNIVEFYVINGLLGFTFGVWVVGAALAAEQIGTNLRATVATTVPNFARALVIPMNLVFRWLDPALGPLTTVGVIGTVVFIMALWGWANVDETYGRQLDYEE